MRMEQSFEVEMNRVLCFGCCFRDVTDLVWPENEWINLRREEAFQTNMCPKKVEVMKYLNSVDMSISVM